MEQKIQIQQPGSQPTQTKQSVLQEQKQQAKGKLSVHSDNHQKVKESFQINNSENFKTSLLLFNIFEWKKHEGEIIDTQIRIGTHTINVSEINKIKCLKQDMFQKYRKIKICFNRDGKDQELFFLAGMKKKHSQFSNHFLWFSKIIDKKMSTMSSVVSEINQQNYQQQEIQIPKNQQVYVKGFILKCSQFLKKWQQRFVLINNEGLFSFKSSKQPCSFQIKNGNVKQIWTRFELMKGFLIIKIKHGLDKTEFAIPISNFSCTSEGNWLSGFYNLMINQSK